MTATAPDPTMNERLEVFMGSHPTGHSHRASDGAVTFCGKQVRTYHRGAAHTSPPGHGRVVTIFSDWPATVTYYANCVDL